MDFVRIKKEYMDFARIKKENVMPTFIRIAVGNQIVVDGAPINTPLTILLTTQTGEVTDQFVLVNETKTIKPKKKIYMLPKGEEK